MTPVNISIIYKVLWFTATFSINMYTLLYAWFLYFQAMAEMEDLQDLQVVASAPVLMDMSIPSEASDVKVNLEWVCV